MDHDIDLKKTLLETCLDGQGYMGLGYNYSFYYEVNWLNLTH